MPSCRDGDAAAGATLDLQLFPRKTMMTLDGWLCKEATLNDNSLGQGSDDRPGTAGTGRVKPTLEALSDSSSGSAQPVSLDCLSVSEHGSVTTCNAPIGCLNHDPNIHAHTQHRSSPQLLKYT